jgi:hypothetical protein
MQLRHRFDTGKHFANTGNNMISEANTNGLKLVAGILDIDLCLAPQDDRQTHDPPSSRSSTSRHGLPTPGDSRQEDIEQPPLFLRVANQWQRHRVHFEGLSLNRCVYIPRPTAAFDGALSFWSRTCW